MVQAQIRVPHPGVHSQVSPQPMVAGKSVQVASGGGPANSPQKPEGHEQLHWLVAGSQVHGDVPPSVAHSQ
jgi:hypothetical protein